MASKYLQKFPVPPDFYQVLNDFGKEVLRHQPDDIIDFAVEYFDFKVGNPDKTFPQNPENMKYNIAKKQIPNEYEKTPYDQLHGKYDGNQSKNDPSLKSESQPPQQEQEQDQQQQVEQQEEQQNEQISEQNQENQQGSEEQRDLNTSKQSGRSKGSEITHPEEKQVTKEFMGDLYSSAVQQTVDAEGGQVSDRQNQSQNEQNVSNNSNNPNNTTHPDEKEQAKNYTQDVYSSAIQQVGQEGDEDQQEQKKEEVILDGPVEEYEKAAVLIQNKYRTQKAKK